MSKKFTYKEVKQYFEDHGCELLEKEYVNCDISMRYRCDCGNDESKITFSNFKKGQRCQKCSSIKKAERYRLTYEEVKQYFEDHDCKLLEKEYKNSKTPMEYECDCGNDECKITFNHFKNGHRCIKCSGKEKPTFEFVQKYFEDRDCKLFETEYINCKTLMRYKCDCGNDKSKITFSEFKKGCRCNDCGTKRAAIKRTFTFKEVKQYFEDNNCELFETEYINCKTLMRYRCNCGNIKSKITFDRFKRGTRCKECLIKRISGKNRYNWIEDREEFEEKKKFKKKCRDMLLSALKRTGQKKIDRTYKMLGYTAGELKQHIYVHSNWEKVKDKVYHIDHFYPIKAFLDYCIRDIKLINCLENLQPLTKEDNLKKGAKYDEKEFEEWLIGKGYEIICK